MKFSAVSPIDEPIEGLNLDCILQSDTTNRSAVQEELAMPNVSNLTPAQH